MKERITPFQTWEEFENWISINCDKCTKPKTYGCKIEAFVARCVSGDGMMDKNLADRAGLPFSDDINCPEFERK